MLKAFHSAAVSLFLVLDKVQARETHGVVAARSRWDAAALAADAVAPPARAIPSGFIVTLL
jgi:hypothetical protein